MNHSEQTNINHDKHPDETKSRTHRLSKLPDDGDPWAPNNLLTPEQKKNTCWTPVDQATDRKLRPQPTKMNSQKSGPYHRKVQIGKDQEKAQSEIDSHSKNRGGTPDPPACN